MGCARNFRWTFNCLKLCTRELGMDDIVPTTDLGLFKMKVKNEVVRVFSLKNS